MSLRISMGLLSIVPAGAFFAAQVRADTKDWMALAAAACPMTRGFLPWRLSDAGPVPVASSRWAGIRNPSHFLTWASKGWSDTSIEAGWQLVPPQAFRVVDQSGSRAQSL
jgi:hypothetical protein